MVKSGVPSNQAPFPPDSEDLNKSAYLFKFGKDFKASKFITAIDSVNGSITGTSMNLKLQKSIEPLLNKASSYTIKFYNSIFISSSWMTV